ncbi:RNA-dependent RNA polymerase [Striga asiatica]|uniref:RNA-dependent RNA polymerase n=1 Tax=Striga asiatica TaxID=4170 RepID=A0A5A7PGH6_STRAF|nr:RNA-dependent RNA polymerase [Striga asiatica]
MGKTIQLSGFPYLVPADEVKNFLENFTGVGTVVALEVKPSKRSPRPYAKVQFTNSKCADIILDIASKRLNYGSSYLRAWQSESEKDIVTNPRHFVHEMEQVTLNFGCQISRERFSVLWKASGVSVKFGTGMKKMHFFFTYNSEDYRLQLSYESIWQIVLYSPHGQTSKILLIQLFGAPRISKKLKDSIHSFFRETPDEQWIRTTDFTPSCIGQSSSLCLQLPHGMHLPNFKDNFVYYKDSRDSFYLDQGLPFTDPTSSLVPIIRPVRVELPYKILFKVCSLVQTGCLSGPTLDYKFFQLINPGRFNIKYIEHALEKLYYLKECCYDPVTWLFEQYEKYRTLKELPSSPTISLDDGLVYVHRVQITPTRVYFSGPEVNMSNRVLRQYKKFTDNFLRVSFVDEEWERMYSTDLSPKSAVNGSRRTKLYERVLSILQNGIKIGNKKFDFLAFSSSQLRDNSLWMFSPSESDGLDADAIRRWMGDFRTIKNVAKYAARLGQSFGSSTETLTVNVNEIDFIDDIERVKDGKTYVFSDGIGKISADFARKVASKCGFRNSTTPSAFQIRYGGYKGVVAVDPGSSWKLSLRKSMNKYESENNKLDVLACSKYQPCFLNRQIITLLSTLGVQDHVFEKKQREAVAQLDGILVDPVKAREALSLMYPGENTNILKEMLKCGYKPDAEPFLSMMLQTFRASKLLDLRLKARVFLPRARQMMGCLDETGVLDYGEVFVQFSGTERGKYYDYDDDNDDYDDGYNDYVLGECNYVVKGNVVVAKNPCLHPGDVRVLRAVDVPGLYHMVDCVVFPQKGERPHPNECSGSDLDGDIYFVCWDSDLIPPRQVAPMDYSPSPTIELDHNVTIEEVEEYFTNYMVNDSLGIIANAHTVFADCEPEKGMSKPCLDLAHLFSIAVDFPKTGVPADIPSHLRVKSYPDFMEKPDKPTYESNRIIGKLFREVKDLAPHTAPIRSFTRDVAQRAYDPDLEVPGFQDYVDEAFDYKTEYDYKLGNLMEYYGIKTEAEILSGGIMKMSKTFDRRKDAEAVGAAVRSLRNEARAWFRRGSESDEPRAKASAWYHVAYHPEFWGKYNVGLKRDHYISFPWCVYDRLVRIKREAWRIKNEGLLRREFGRRLNLG